MTNNEKIIARCHAPETWARITAAIQKIVDRERGDDESDNRTTLAAGETKGGDL
jgi:hypothetical protein